MSETLRTLENHAAVIQSMMMGSQAGMIEKRYYDMVHSQDQEEQETAEEEAEKVKSRFINAFKG